MTVVEEKANLVVVKRNGKKVDFDGSKIAIAIKKGFENIQLVEEKSIGSGFNVVDGNLMSFNNYDIVYYVL